MYIECFRQWLKHICSYSKSVANPKKNPLFPRANEGTRISKVLERLKAKCPHSSPYRILQLSGFFHTFTSPNNVLHFNHRSSCALCAEMPVPEGKRNSKTW